MVVSGIGLTNLYHFTHGDHPCVPLDSDPAPDLPRIASERAGDQSCPHSVETMAICVQAYGGASGNLAVRTVATRGLYIGGGIAPKNIALLSGSEFLDAFSQKGPRKDLLQTIPIKIITNAQAGLLGAATYANEL